jgi:hypothetical protein
LQAQLHNLHVETSSALGKKLTLNPNRFSRTETFFNMALELTGTLSQLMNEVTGTGRTGNPWVKQEFVIEYMDGQYAKKVCLSVWGQDKVNDLKQYTPGDALKVSFNLESREYNGRWYTEARAWRVESGEGGGSSSSDPYAGQSAPAAAEARPRKPEAPNLPVSSGDDDLPF